MSSARSALAGLIFCATLNTTTAAAQLPELGSEFDRLDRASYRCSLWEQGERCARPGTAADTLAGESVIEVVLFYRDGVLVRTVRVFDERRYDALVPALSARFGVPIAGTEKLKAGMGGVFDNRQHIWGQGGQVWMFEQFFARIIHSGLWQLSQDEFEMLMTERERLRVRGARDL